MILLTLQTQGCPMLAFLALSLSKRRVLRKACITAAMPPGREMKSRAIPHSRAPVQFHPAGRNDSYSNHNSGVFPPVRVSPDFGAYNSASRRASGSSNIEVVGTCPPRTLCATGRKVTRRFAFLFLICHDKVVHPTSSRRYFP